MSDYTRDLLKLKELVMNMPFSDLRRSLLLSIAKALASHE